MEPRRLERRQQRKSFGGTRETGVEGGATRSASNGVTLAGAGLVAEDDAADAVCCLRGAGGGRWGMRMRS